jgi:glycosyltransferase involved in cell wall biosynthesis
MSGARSASPVALVHDYLLVRRGAERTFEAMAECWPEAPIYTLLYDPEGSEGRFEERDIRTSHLQHLGSSQSNFRNLLPAFPIAARLLPVQGHQLIVSSSSAFAHGVRPAPEARHVSYCHSPFRYAWFEHRRAMEEVPGPARAALAATLAGIRAADRHAARQVTSYLANSEITRDRIEALWGRESDVVHPPVEVDRFSATPAPVGPGGRRSLLVVCELVAHKRVDVALEAAALAGMPIQVVGDGPERERLEARFARPGQAEFMGRVDDVELERLYAAALALILPNTEEFGIAAVEAQASGRPVVAAAAGGALETVVDGETGILVAPGDVEALAQALAATDFDRFDPRLIAAHSRRFSRETFKRRLSQWVEAVAEEPRQDYAAAAKPTGGRLAPPVTAP